MKYLEIKEMDTMSYGSREAMNRLRVNLGYCGDQYKRILVTSSVPDEGKSFVSINLWRMLAEAGSRVVLVDADIRRSVLRSRHQFVTEEHRNAAGLANYLAGQTDVRNVIYSTNIDGAYMVPTFRSIANPSLLLQNPRFGEMMEILSKEYDYVLVDGIVGSQTWGKLGVTVTTAPAAATSAVTATISSNMPLVKMGSRSDAVKALQEKLNALGYDCGTVDGIFGAKTLAAVKAFQTAKSLSVDGIVGVQTWGALR